MDPNQLSKHDATRQRQLEREQAFTALVLEPRSRWYWIGQTKPGKWSITISTLLIVGLIGLSSIRENSNIQPREFRESLGSTSATLPAEDSAEVAGSESTGSGSLTRQSDSDSPDASRTGRASDPESNQQASDQFEENQPKITKGNNDARVVILGNSSSNIDPGQEDVFPTLTLTTVEGVIAYEVMAKKGYSFISAGIFMAEAGLAPATVKLNLKFKRGSVLSYRIVLHRADGSSEPLEIRQMETK
jgi:hypothetical protein